MAGSVGTIFSQRVVVPDGKTFAFKVNRVKPYVGPATARLIPASRGSRNNEAGDQDVHPGLCQKNGPIGAEFQEQLEEKNGCSTQDYFPIADLSGNVSQK